jgi:hypothetical protein
MASRLREPFGKAGLIVAVVALVAALVGGAYAANTSGKRQHKKKNNAGLNGKQKKEVKKIAKGFQGTGPAGPQGPAGSNGNDGANGSNGSKGDPGNTGNTGQNGVSPVGTEFSGNAGTCTEGQGGVEFEGAEEAVTYACNGKEGSPWTANGALPPGATETGSWTPATIPTAPTEFQIPISLPIPLAANISPADTVVVEEGEGPTADCPGTSADPQAAAGKFCLYVTFAYDLAEEGGVVQSITLLDSGASLLSPIYGVGKTGALLNANIDANVATWGTWAVTAPTS